NPTTLALEKHLVQSYRPGISLFIVYDMEGNLLAGAYPEKNPDNSPAGLARREKRRQALRGIYGVNYAYRDYYHARGDNLAPGDRPAFHNHAQPYISE